MPPFTPSPVVRIPMSDLPMETDVQTVQTLLQEGSGFLFLDCREQAEYATARIEGATLLPMSEIQTRVGELDGQQECHVVIHCHHGGRSLQVAHWLRQQGYTQAQSMAGGIDLWSQLIDASIPRY